MFQEFFPGRVPDFTGRADARARTMKWLAAGADVRQRRDGLRAVARDGAGGPRQLHCRGFDAASRSSSQRSRIVGTRDAAPIAVPPTTAMKTRRDTEASQLQPRLVLPARVLLRLLRLPRFLLAPVPRWQPAKGPIAEQPRRPRAPHHLIKNFANGVPLWPENPIHYLSNLRYPAGVDLFNSLLLLLGVDLMRGLHLGRPDRLRRDLLRALSLGRRVRLAGFLFNGGLAGFQVLQTWKFIDYQGVPDDRVEKPAALDVHHATRFALRAAGRPAPALSLARKVLSPRERRTLAATTRADRCHSGSRSSLYASMPLFHVHTFMALSIVAAFLFASATAACSARQRCAWTRRAAIAFLPATFFVWTITDHFQARSLFEWKPGWVQNSGEFEIAVPRSSGSINFGIFIPIVLALIGTCIWRVAQIAGTLPFQGSPERSRSSRPRC